MNQHKHDLTYAPFGRTGLITVYCRICKHVAAYAKNAGEAQVMVLESQGEPK